MTPAPLQTHFNSSRLMHVLADLEGVSTAAVGSGFAEKLGLWVSFTDAIALSAVHSAAQPILPQARVTTQATRLAQDLAHTRSGLEALITGRGTLPAGKAAIKLPHVVADDTLPGASAYEPYRRYYTAHQREMESSLGPLRAKVRGELSRSTPALQQLAAMDATLENILSERESRVLAKVASLMQRRFMHLLRTHSAPPDADPKQDPWLVRFGLELQNVLLAELELRLQPTLGLLEAYQHENHASL
ncbi:MAG: hypothetical protein CFE44_16625 [Burkholderiales bacterium PBB4]|nr:MAG: hypothetical protein CFE44_16625 [Burkholderiales bacterium PBB4]